MIVFPPGFPFISPTHNSKLPEIDEKIYAVHWHAYSWGGGG